MTDEQKTLSGCPFDYSEDSRGVVRVSFKGKLVYSLKGKEAVKFINKMESADKALQQIHMAKITGQFKFGTERVAKHKRAEK